MGIVPSSPHAKSKPLPDDLILAQFARFYPGLYRGWEPMTRDGSIPWKLFWRLYRRIPAVEAWEGLTAAYNISLGTGIAHGEPVTKRMIRDLIRRAYPDG